MIAAGEIMGNRPSVMRVAADLLGSGTYRGMAGASHVVHACVPAGSTVLSLLSAGT